MRSVRPAWLRERVQDLSGCEAFQAIRPPNGFKIAVSMVSRAGPSQRHPQNPLQGRPDRAGEGGEGERGSRWVDDGIAAMGAAAPQTGRVRTGAKGSGPSGTPSEPGLRQPTGRPHLRRPRQNRSWSWLYMTFLCCHLGEQVRSVRPAHHPWRPFSAVPGPACHPLAQRSSLWISGFCSTSPDDGQLTFPKVVHCLTASGR